MTAISFPCTANDIQALFEDFLFDPNIDGYQPGALSARTLKSGNISYKFYGKKAFEFRPGLPGFSKLVLPVEIYAKLFPDFSWENDGKPVKVPPVFSLTDTQLQLLIQELRARKDAQFRSLGEPFACCNDFERCSDARQCLHKETAFHNGCHYRRNLEQGCIFYGSNKTI